MFSGNLSQTFLHSFIHSFINLLISSLGSAHFLPAVTPAQQKDAKHSKIKYKYFKNEGQKKKKILSRHP